MAKTKTKFLKFVKFLLKTLLHMVCIMFYSGVLSYGISESFALDFNSVFGIMFFGIYFFPFYSLEWFSTPRSYKGDKDDKNINPS